LDPVAELWERQQQFNPENATRRAKTKRSRDVHAESNFPHAQ